MKKTIQKAFADYNNTVTPDYFLQFSEAKEGFIDENGRHPKYIACNSTWDLVFTFNSAKELKERLNAEVQDYNMSRIQGSAN